MNPLLNPFISIPFIKNYVADKNRLERLSSNQLERYRNKALQKILAYAANVPLYQEKYHQSAIKPQTIKTISEITKLPFISKQDLRTNYPDNIIPRNYDRSQGYVVSTGGTSGKSVSLYVDFETMLRASGPTLAEMQYFNINLRKAKIAHIGNFNRDRIDGVYQEKFFPKIKHLYNINNTLNIDVNVPLTTLMEQLNTFKPDVIISYPTIYQHLAYLKKKGHGEHVTPQLMQVGGAILDEYTRKYVENAFNTRLLNIYPSVEAQATIAFECYENNWHIHTDFFHIEAIDEHNNLVGPGERGHIVLTRLWGKGTPIIRYTGMDDWVTLSDGETCSCGQHSPIFKKPIEGRINASIILPDGKVFPCGAFCFVEPVLNDLQTFKVRQYQVVQQKIDTIEIHLVIDEELRNSGPSVDEIKNRIQKIYEEKCGPLVTITVFEVPEIKSDPQSGKPAPNVVTKVAPSNGFKTLDRL